MATLYVNADHDDRSDAWTHAEAADDPGSPFASVQAAALLIEPGDILSIEPSTLGHANVAIYADPNMYEGMHHLRNESGDDVLPAALNGGEDPILVVGHIVDGVRPKVRRLEFRELDNWWFEGIQVGYDLDSELNGNTAQVLHNCKDLKFTNILFTGGGNYCVGARGLMHWVMCEVHSPFGNSGDFLDGAGFHVRSLDTSTGIRHPVTFRFTSCWFEGVEGEDCIQTGLGLPESEGYCEVLFCTFKDIVQSQAPNAPHTDCTQALGGAGHLLVGNRYINCSLPFIASDNRHGWIAIIGNFVDEDCFSGFHGQGTARWVIAHNTILGTGIGIAIGNRYNLQTDSGFIQHLTIVNNLANEINFASSIVVAEDSIVENNILTREPGRVTPWGTQLEGLPEFGTSARLVAEGFDGNYELSNEPVESPGIGQGRSLTGLDLTEEELDYLENDILGRAYAVLRDVGAFQSDSETLVVAAPRAPYVTDKTPIPDSVDVSGFVSATAKLRPVPGETIDESTVVEGTAWITASNGAVAPVVVTLSELDEDGNQIVTIDPQGAFRELVFYTVHLDGIADTGGSEIVPVEWSFRGPDATALKSAVAPPWKIAVFSGGVGAFG